MILDGAQDRKAMLTMVQMMTMMMTVMKRGDLQVWDVTRWPGDLWECNQCFLPNLATPQVPGTQWEQGCSGLPGTALVGM